MKESRMAGAVSPSLTRKLYNMALEIGDDVIDLTLGDPDVLTPEEIRVAACESIMLGKTRYSENAGLLDVRKSYAAFFEKQYGFQVNPAQNIMVTVGGMEALYLSIAAMVDEGDEVIVLSPYYVNYVEMLNMCGGNPLMIDRLGVSDEMLLSNIRDAITDKTVGIIVNNPCNPVGDVLSSAFIEGLAEIVDANDLFVISDEVYSSLVYDDKPFDSIITQKGMRDRVILIDSCSKRFAMTGWRVGFAVGPQQIIANMVKMQENIAACASLPSQYAAMKAYQEDFDYSYIKDTYRRRRDIVYSKLSTIPCLIPKYPEATFYCFVDISSTGLTSEVFAYALLESMHVAVVPGKSYGPMYDNYIRIAYTQDDERLIEALERIQKFINII